MGVTTDSTSAVEERIERLSAASLRRVIEPDSDLVGEIGPGLVVPRHLMSVADLNLDLTQDQWERLSREEVAAIFDAGVRFESLLMAGFGLWAARRPDLVDPRVRYVLHEVGEETRHSRLFVRALEQLRPTAVNPFTTGRLFRTLDRLITARLLEWPAVFVVLVLTGEEAPDLMQKRTSEHPDTDPFLRQINKYHRLEEARHLSFARMLLPEVWAKASLLQRWFVRRVVPYMMEGAVDQLVHPGVYATVGLPTWPTWRAAARSQSRRAFKAEAFRPILAELLKVGAFGRRGQVNGQWRRICLVDSYGRRVAS